jgi:RNA polymerase sigma factor (sigma-70 family)
MELPDRERDVVILRMLEGRSTREAAEALGCAEGTVKATLSHALKKLHSSMEIWVR